MARISLVKKSDQAYIITDLIHDCWFDKDTILHDSANSILIIRYKKQVAEWKEVVRKIWFLKKVNIPIAECFLKIHGVDSYSVEDEANIGTYDFNEIKYSPQSKLITITSGFPIKINVYVERFEIVVEETDNIIERKLSWSL